MCCHKLRGVFCPVRAETAFPTCLLVRKRRLSWRKFEAFSRREKRVKSLAFPTCLLVGQCRLSCRKFEAFSRREKRVKPLAFVIKQKQISSFIQKQISLCLENKRTVKSPNTNTTNNSKYSSNNSNSKTCSFNRITAFLTINTYSNKNNR